eukprot:TRINITY_DN8664_c0_g1_i1.p1 TRINITY_DN8664_c0_g1~~TRINITY_DN8664_c0_g1_i1.p1  ORF type:complete len:152 (-),score=23.29 TRINITY_DN8664_c0_g1_i1:30-485(-)
MFLFLFFVTLVHCGPIKWSICDFSTPTSYPLQTVSITMPTRAVSGFNLTMSLVAKVLPQFGVSNITGGQFTIDLKKPDRTNLYSFNGQTCDLLSGTCPCPCSLSVSLLLEWYIPLPGWVGGWTYTGSSLIYDSDYNMLSCILYQSIPVEGC